MNRETQYLNPLRETNPEFCEFFGRFAGEEVVHEPGKTLDEPTRYMAILAALLGCQGKELFEAMIPQALEAGLTPVQLREVTYQAVAYLGIGRVYPFIQIVDRALTSQGVELPLPPQGTTTPETRVELGEAKQVKYFGDGFRGFASSGSEERRHINRWLSGNCFGDYYTRNGLTDAQREMITFCFIAAQGGCEPQLLSHAGGNFNLGNDKAFMISVVSQCMPYIGYPRTLNALRILDEAAKNREEQ